MATDAKGKLITQDAIDMIDKYNNKTRYKQHNIKISVSLRFNLDYSLFHGSDEDGEIYDSILPQTSTGNIYYSINIGDEITTAKWYSPNDCVEKKFKVTKIEKQIDDGDNEDGEAELNCYTIVSVIPVDDNPIQE